MQELTLFNFFTNSHDFILILNHKNNCETYTQKNTHFVGKHICSKTEKLELEIMIVILGSDFNYCNLKKDRGLRCKICIKLF